MRLCYLIVILAGISACQLPNTDTAKNSDLEPYQVPEHHTDLLSRVFEAHGGYVHWNSMKALSYMKGEEKTIANLQNRKIKIVSPNQTIGFDGNEVWILPDSIDASRARFYHNLYFYFFAMPFVVGDVGANYEEVDRKEILGKVYRGIKVSYNEGVGDASDDNYILWVDPETYQMEWLMYTVTYSSGEPSDNYRLIAYTDWITVNGLRLPSKLQWYSYDNDTIGDQRGDPVLFSDIALDTSPPSDLVFEMPENATIAPR